MAKRVLHVGNLPTDVNQLELEETFHTFDPDARVEIKHRYAFVHMSNEAADRAMAAKLQLRGADLRIENARRGVDVNDERNAAPPSRVLFMVNFERNALPKLKERCAEIGKVRTEKGVFFFLFVFFFPQFFETGCQLDC